MPVVFALVDGTLVTAVDHKPKSTRNLVRLANVAANPAASLLVQQYEENWSRLWWVRADGTGEVVDALALEHRQALVDKYDEYRSHPPDGPGLLVHISEVRGWSASRDRFRPPLPR